MSQVIVYLLLAAALFLPVLGALALRVLGPRLNGTQFYGAAASMFALTLLSVFVLARSDLPSLQLGRLSVLLPVTSPGDVTVDLPIAEAPTEPPPIATGEPVEAPATTDAPAATVVAEPNTTAIAAPTELPSPTLAPTEVPTATPAPTEPPTPAPTAPPAPAGPRRYTVQPGDTLRSIAEQFNVSVKAIIDANKLTDAEADSLRVGQELVIPDQ